MAPEIGWVCGRDRVRVAFLAVACVAAPAIADDRRADTSRLSIMTFNAEFLWDGLAPEEGQVAFAWKGDPDAAAEHMQRVADVIIFSDPDIVHLVEVENLDALTLFRDSFLAGRGYEPYFVKGKDTYTGQDVALLTRIDPVSVRRDERSGVSGSEQKGVSKHLIARFEAEPDLRFSLIGLHFVAFPTREDRRLERQAQADAIVGMAIDEADAGYEVIIVGDFNDYDGAADSLDHIDSAPISTVLTTIRAMRPGDPGDDLINAASLLDKSQRYTAHYDKNGNGRVDYPQELTSIDHVLIGPGLAGRIETVDIPHRHDPMAGPDHYPVVVWFRLADPTPDAPDGVRIVALLPDPPGDDRQHETATLRNFGAAAVDLTGWRLRDLSGGTWSLDPIGTLAPGAQATVVRLGQRMSLNNDGDTVELIDASGVVVQRVSYGRVGEGEVVSFGP